MYIAFEVREIKSVMRKSIIILSIVSFLFIGCEEEPTDSEENPYQQEHIPWPSLADSPWPMFHHDPQGTGRSQYVGPKNGVIQNTFNDSIYIDGSFAIDENNSLYLVTNKYGTNYLYKFSESGLIEWICQYMGGLYVENFTTPLLGVNGLIYASSNSHWIYVINDDGTVSWSKDIGEIISSNIVLDADGNLYLVTETSWKMVSLSPDGSFRWELILPGGITAGDQPAVFSPDGSVLYITGMDSIYAISTNNGDILWSYWQRYAIFPLVDNNGNIYYSNDKDSSVTCLLPSGNLRWRTKASEVQAIYFSSIFNSPTMDTNGNLYFCAKLKDARWGIVSLDNEGALRWIWYGDVGSDLISDSNSNIYFSGQDETYMYCYKLSYNGELIWVAQIEHRGGIPCNSPSIGSNGCAYFPLINSIDPQVVVVN